MEKKDTCIIFGGHSPIAMATAKELSESQKVYLVTRRVDQALTEECSGFEQVHLVEADIGNPGEAAELIEEIYSKNERVKSAIFLQRYRPTTESCYETHCQVELWSIQEAIDSISSMKDVHDVVQILISSSPAAERVLVDQDMYYHTVKASQEALMRFNAVKQARLNISVTCVRIGSLVLKSRAKAYWDSRPKLVSTLKESSPSGLIQTSESIGKAIAGLASNVNSCVSGQVIDVDGGWSLCDSAQVAKSIMDKES